MLLPSSPATTVFRVLLLLPPLRNNAAAACVPVPACRAQISPRPGFVLKTKLVDKGMKVFVNVCQHERIGESGMVKKLDKDGQEVI